jgi:hypothetical protein
VQDATGAYRVARLSVLLWENVSHGVLNWENDTDGYGERTLANPLPCVAPRPQGLPHGGAPRSEG